MPRTIILLRNGVLYASYNNSTEETGFSMPHSVILLEKWVYISFPLGSLGPLWNL